MASFPIRTAVLLMASLALMATPSFAQRGDRQSGGDGGRRASVQRAQPRGGGQSSGRVAAQRRAVPRGQVKSQGRVESQRRAVPRGRVKSQGRAESQIRTAPQRRVAPRGRVEPQRRVAPLGRVGMTVPRRQVAPPGRVGLTVPRRQVAPGLGSGSFRTRTYNAPRYGYRPYVNRSYVLPYGYRPFGYRPGWSLNLYFGRPYPYSSARAVYGYYAVDPGRGYGAVRIVDAPRDAHVFVDGYYAGVVDDYDGVFQHLNLEAGSHHIEIEAEGYPLIAFDVRVWPGRTITYRANIR